MELIELRSVKRNWFASNWVLVNFGKADKRPSKRRLRLILLAFGVTSVVGVGSISVSSEVFIHQASYIPTTAAPSSGLNCQEKLEALIGKVVSAPRIFLDGVPEVRAIESAEYGGLQALTVICRKSALNTYWIAASGSWRLTKISRPPVRRSGDRSALGL